MASFANTPAWSRFFHSLQYRNKLLLQCGQTRLNQTKTNLIHPAVYGLSGSLLPRILFRSFFASNLSPCVAFSKETKS